MSLPFEFTVEGPPVTQQAKKKSRLRKWRRKVNKEALAQWGSQSMVKWDVAVVIDYFCYDSSQDLRDSLDVDNVPKPILDALENLVFVDDKQVIDIVCRRRNLYGPLEISKITSLMIPYIRKADQFLHITVRSANSGALMELNL